MRRACAHTRLDAQVVRIRLQKFLHAVAGAFFLDLADLNNGAAGDAGELEAVVAAHVDVVGAGVPLNFEFACVPCGASAEG